MSHKVSIRDAVKSYGDFHAVDHISLEIEEGEFFTLLGPSGCGKTTLLRMIAGFNEIDGGEIYFDDKLINYVPAHKRNIGMVFQNYAVFPHMTVKENTAYGLKARKIIGTELEKRVEEGLSMMKIDNLKDRRPSQLSGGQQQRVALARAIVIHPGLMLMDEPLSNLDAKLRLEMRSVIRKIQQNLGITTIYVTHDQDEALAISDRIAVVNSGHVEQLGSPHDIYRNPANQFVANFIGKSNFIKGSSDEDGFQVLGEARFDRKLKGSYQGDILVSVRPEQITLSRQPVENGLRAKIAASTFLGTHYEYEAALDNGQMVLANQYNVHHLDVLYPGDAVNLSFSAEHMNVYTPDGKEALL